MWVGWAADWRNGAAADVVTKVDMCMNWGVMSWVMAWVGGRVLVDGLYLRGRWLVTEKDEGTADAV